MKLLLLGGVLIALFITPYCKVNAQTELDPATYCKEKEHANESRCIVYLGGQTGFYSRSGNVANTNTHSVAANSRYIVFLHDAGGPPGIAEQLANTLRTKGYVVRGVDHDLDDQGGPGVDYFFEQDRSAAATVAELVNAALPSNQKRLEPRLQKVKNPPGFLGVWLYEKQK